MLWGTACGGGVLPIVIWYCPWWGTVCGGGVLACGDGVLPVVVGYLPLAGGYCLRYPTGYSGIPRVKKSKSCLQRPHRCQKLSP